MVDFKISEDYIVDKRGYAQSYPVGSVVIIMSSTVPDGWLLCDGSPVNTFTYQELHKAITNTYGGTAYSLGTTDQSGVSTTFNLPPLVVNATHNPTGRFAVSRSSSEPSYPANFAHSHASYKDNATNFTTSNYSANHNHATMNVNSNNANILHTHNAIAGANVLNNSTVNTAATSRQSSANNTTQYHNVPVHDHGGASNTTIAFRAQTGIPAGTDAFGHLHAVQVHSADNISHTHTVNHGSITVDGVTVQGINTATATQIPLSKEVYFIIKY
jgi:microcystin-dependent protein